MIKGRMNVVLDSAWGSSGKGKVSAWLAKNFKVTDASSANMPNAGHTVDDSGRFVYKILPAASHYGADVWLAPGTIYDPGQLHREIAFEKSGMIYIHERCGILRPEHAEAERSQLNSIASTMQGSGACLAEKIMRRAALGGGMLGRDFRASYRYRLQGGGTGLHEVAQGWALSLDHGTHYPECTSRNCGIGAALDTMALPPSLLGDVYLVVRTFPIRVGNTVGGYSGGWMPDQVETSWEEIERNTGLMGLAEKERTTVTKRVRRVATFSWQLLRDAVASNGVTKIVVTFPEYLDARAREAKTWLHLPGKVHSFCQRIEDIADVPVVAVSTGPETDSMVTKWA